MPEFYFWFDFDESTFSPPSYDDSFVYLRQTKQHQTASSTQQTFRSVDKALNENNSSVSITSQVAQHQKTVSDIKAAKEIDFSKHPLPCQPFIPDANKGSQFIEVKPPKVVVAGKVKAKSQGTDDGFHGEPALCGKSIVHVANQMMSGKNSKLTSSEHAEEIPKKGSKSLPVTPLTSPMSTPDSSPKSRRKAYSNRYFTGAFIPDREKYQSGWILGGLLGQSREMVTTKIDEEEEPSPEIVAPKKLSRKKSISSQSLLFIEKDEKAPEKVPAFTNVLQVKPSELREMNFWSPTSM
ncbi:uncharacterized protein LOC105701183 isoform X2 [Orussus abietinus]|uniref:uncharacterized protein LOC105701183 isoform X2 n=1 Tax=Orussus abietinus TaxID=222816 RepID=UPI000625C966|nr:uncharacterized protein LOC105701183 isoform X2 [Orussus abietinus]